MNFLEMKMGEEFIAPIEINIQNLFVNVRYSIPIYQRSYAWKSEQIEQLITDIYDCTDKEKYYLGNLIVNEIQSHEYSVIDGQQRLTTLYLLMAFLDNTMLKTRCLTFETRKEANLVLEKILDFDFTGDKNFEANEMYNDEIVDGITIIQSFFKSHKDYKETIFRNLQKVVLIRTQVPKNIDLNHYFEIMNTRGEQLELHEIAKGRILGKLNKNERNVAAKIWDACARMNEYIQMCVPIDMRSNLFGDKWDSFKCKKFMDVKTEFENATNSNGSATENNFDLGKYYSIEKILTDSKIKSTSNKTSEEENERFESIIDFPTFLMIVDETMNKVENEDDKSLDDKNLIKRLEHNWESPKQAKDFIFNMFLLKFLFDKYIIKREFAKDYKSEGRWSLQKLENNKNEKKPKYSSSFSGEETVDFQKLRILQSGLRITYTSPKTMHWISITLKKLYQDYMADKKIVANDILNELETYCCKKVQKANYRKCLGFEIERIVFTYLDYILFKEFPNESIKLSAEEFKYADFIFQFRASIEHFYPQHPVEGKENWNITKNDRDRYLNNIGNLVLITVKANSRFSNLDPNSKIGSYEYTLEQSLKFIEMEKLRRNNGIWTRKCVEEHANKMFKLLDDEISKHI